jgi:hydroxyacylglutathione hydrolase
MTLDGTRTWLLGERRLAIIDPGPALPAHVEALANFAAGADIVSILVTHDHPDHAQAAWPLAERLRGAHIFAMGDGTLADGQQIQTDDGPLTAMHTPGHTPDHMAFDWPSGHAVFCGDLMMGGLDTALVAPPEGNLQDYLDSLERIRAREPHIIYPAHGEPITDPAGAIARYVAHRAARQQQVLAVLAAGARTLEQVADGVYGGTVPPALRDAALLAARAYLDNLLRARRITRVGDRWLIAGSSGAQ